MVMETINGTKTTCQICKDLDALDFSANRKTTSKDGKKLIVSVPVRCCPYCGRKLKYKPAIFTEHNERKRKPSSKKISA